MDKKIGTVVIAFLILLMLLCFGIGSGIINLGL